VLEDVQHAREAVTSVASTLKIPRREQFLRAQGLDDRDGLRHGQLEPVEDLGQGARLVVGPRGEFSITVAVIPLAAGPAEDPLGRVAGQVDQEIRDGIAVPGGLSPGLLLVEQGEAVANAREVLREHVLFEAGGQGLSQSLVAVHGKIIMSERIRATATGG